MSAEPSRAPSIRWRVLRTLVPAFALVVLGSAWAFASPVGSSADENYHLASIWCAAGDHAGCVSDGMDGSVRVPEKVAKANCFALHNEINARCTWLLTTELVRTDAVNPATAAYPPLFYLAMRTLVGSDVDRSVLVMRLANVCIAAGLLALTLLLAPVVVRRALAVVWTVTLIPVGIFFVASVNPSSWAIIGGGLFWACAWTLARAPDWRSPTALVAGATALLTAVMAIGARSDMVFVIGLSILAVLIMEWKRVRRRLPVRWLVTGLAIVGAIFIAVAWAFNIGEYLSRFTLSFPPGNADADQPNALVKTLLEFPAFVAGIFGGQEPWTQHEGMDYWGTPGYTWHGFTYGVGSVDVINPSIAAVLAGACAAGVLFLGLGRFSRRKLIVVGGVAVAFLGQIVVMRALVAFGAGWSDGVQWALQPRYFVPICMVIVGFTVAVFPAVIPFLSRVQAMVLATLLSIAAVTSLAATMGRFVNGQEHTWVQIDPSTGWWWSWGLSPTGFVVLGGVAGLVYMFGMMVIAREHTQVPGGERSSLDAVGRP